MSAVINTSPILPDDGEELAKLIAAHITLEEARIRWRTLRYQLAHGYMQGVRRFTVAAGPAPTLYTFQVDDDGKMPLSVPELLTHVNKVAGLIQQMDLWPSTARRGDAMQTVRDAGVTQAVLDSVYNEDHFNAVKAQYAHLVSILGTCGITGHLVDHPTIGLTTDLEVVHPFELFSFPAVGFDGTKVRGKIRIRPVPVDQLKEVYGSKITRNLEKMTIARRKPIYASELELGGVPVQATGQAYSLNQDKSSYLEAKVWELWLDGPAGTCIQYAIGSGHVTIENRDFRNSEYYCPLGIGRFWNTGDFYGAGLFDAVYTMCRELELNMRSLINNVRDLDRYPPVLIPPGALDERMVMNDTGPHGLRLITLKQEPSLLGNSDFRPTTIPMNNAGEIPGKTALYLENAIRSRLPIRDILAEKGRVDSYSGLQFLEEESQRSAISPISNTVRAFSDLHRGVTQQAFARLMRSPAKLPVKRVDLTLIGAVINFDEGTLSLTENRVPDLNRLSFGVKENSPKSKSVRKQEAKDYLDKNQVSMQQYKLLAIKEGWDPAVWMDDDVAAYRSVVQHILMIYGDGQTPGPLVWETAGTASPALQLTVLNAFMSSPEMHLASAEVVDEFTKYRDLLLSYQGKMVPQSIPDPYTAAMMGGGLPPTPPGGMLSGSQGGVGVPTGSFAGVGNG